MFGRVLSLHYLVFRKFRLSVPSRARDDRYVGVKGMHYVSSTYPNRRTIRIYEPRDVLSMRNNSFNGRRCFSP